MLPAQAVCGGSYLGVVGFCVAVVLDLCAPLNGVEKDVGMDMLAIRMHTDHCLIFRKLLVHEFLRQLHCQIRRDLSRLEGKNHMVILHATR